MNRRGFLGMIAAGLAAAVDPERLLWEPGRKLISVPKPTLPIGMRMMRMQYVSQYDVKTDRRIGRVDMLYGWGCISPFVRIVG